MSKKLWIIAGISVGLLILAACTSPTPTASPEVPTDAAPAAAEVTVPYLELWQGSAHNAVDTEPFRHWDADDPAEVPTSCARCHTTAGYRDYLGDDGSEASKVDAAVPP